MFIQHLKGFYGKENDGIRDFRWMQPTAKIRISDLRQNSMLIFEVCCPATENCVLSVIGSKKFTVALVAGWQNLAIDVDEVGLALNGEYELKCDFALDTKGKDDRILSLMLGEISEIFADDKPDIVYRQGFYTEEIGNIRNFRWMQNKADFTINKWEKDNWIYFEVGYTGRMPVVLSIKGDKEISVNLMNGWQQLGFRLEELFGSADGSKLELCCLYDNEIKNKNDKRSLCLMIGRIMLGTPSEYVKNSAEIARGLFRDTQLKALPTCLDYETVAKCNLKCAMCACDETLNKFQNTRESGMAKTWPLYERLLPYASKIVLHTSGEVLMGQDFWKALTLTERYEQEHSLETEIFSNGLLLTPEKIKQVLESSLTDIVISVDAATEKTYKRIRGGDFKKLIENINNLVNENKKCHDKLRIAMGFVIMRENIEELPSFVHLAASLGVETITFWPLFSTGIDMPKKEREGFTFYYKQQMLIYYPHLTMAKVNEAKEIAEKLNVRIGVSPHFATEYSGFKHADIPYPIVPELFDKYVLENQAVAGYENVDFAGQDSETYKGCYLPWSTAYITTEGKFSPCAVLLLQGGIGSVSENKFEEVWNGETMQSLRQHIIDGKIHPICKKAQCIFANKKF